MYGMYLDLGSTAFSGFISANSTNVVNLNNITEMLVKHSQTMPPI